MKTFEITLTPLSGFGTPLKGDTLFGYICWQAAYNEKLFGMNLETLLSDYLVNPFLIISSAFFKIDNYYVLKRPDMPLDMLFDFNTSNKADLIAKRKELKDKRWMIVKNSSKLQTLKSADMYLSDKQLLGKLTISKDAKTQGQIHKKDIKSFVVDYAQPHNTISRLTGTTGEDRFTPYSVDQKVFIKDIELVIFAALRDEFRAYSLVEALRLIGKSGFGKDASTGLGRFEVNHYKEIDLQSIGAENPNACYTLAPCVPEKDAFSKIFFTPFTRFGRHGDILAKSGKPFKNPVIMADEGAVCIIKDAIVFNKPYIGKAIKGLSKVQPNTVSQGYSLYIPVKVED